jgi:hypothetical protein
MPGRSSCHSRAARVLLEATCGTRSTVTAFHSASWTCRAVSLSRAASSRTLAMRESQIPCAAQPRPLFDLGYSAPRRHCSRPFHPRCGRGEPRCPRGAPSPRVDDRERRARPHTLCQSSRSARRRGHHRPRKFLSRRQRSLAPPWRPRRAQAENPRRLPDSLLCS